jgi:hypothetical protein
VEEEAVEEGTDLIVDETKTQDLFGALVDDVRGAESLLDETEMVCPLMGKEGIS